MWLAQACGCDSRNQSAISFAWTIFSFRSVVVVVRCESDTVPRWRMERLRGQTQCDLHRNDQQEEFQIFISFLHFCFQPSTIPKTRYKIRSVFDPNAKIEDGMQFCCFSYFFEFSSFGGESCEWDHQATMASQGPPKPNERWCIHKSDGFHYYLSNSPYNAFYSCVCGVANGVNIQLEIERLKWNEQEKSIFNVIHDRFFCAFYNFRTNICLQSCALVATTKPFKFFIPWRINSSISISTNSWFLTDTGEFPTYEIDDRVEHSVHMRLS